MRTLELEKKLKLIDACSKKSNEYEMEITSLRNERDKLNE